MPCAKGTKPLTKLTVEQIEVLNSKLFKCNNTNLIWAKDIEEIYKRFSINHLKFVRRATVSGISFKICYPYSAIEEEKLKTKDLICFNCKICNLLYFDEKLGILNRGSVSEISEVKETCGRCHRKLRRNLTESKLKNSLAQRVAQNRRETKEKMSASIKKAWARDYDRRVEAVRKSYRENKEHAENLRRASLRLWQNEEYANKIFETCNVYNSGYYNDIFYQSISELAFLLWCDEKSKKISRFCGSIKYDYAGVTRSYRPDFIVDDNTVVEVKHSLSREEDLGRIEQILAKQEACINYAKQNGYFYRLVEVKKDMNSHYKKARKLHGENYRKKDS